MKVLIAIFRVYFKILSALNTDLAARRALLLFQKPRRLKLKKRESKYYQQAKKFTIPWKNGDLHYYTMGESKNPVIFLVHGWESNAGSLAGIAYRLVDMGYRAISIDHPAHGNNRQTRTNIIEAADAFKTVIQHINPKNPFSVIAHSFGSGVTSLTLSQNDFQIDQLIYLTSPNSIIKIFEEYRAILKLGDKVYKRMLEMVRENFHYGSEVLDLRVDHLGKTFDYNKLSLIHDEYDKILPIANSVQIANEYERSVLHKMEKVGHYRMLWTEAVYEKIEHIMSTSQVEVKKKYIHLPPIMLN